jgi:nitroreductase
MCMTDALTPLLTRRSTSVRDMRPPAPSEAELAHILTIATRVPDHGKLCPWRIVVLRGEGALKLGAIAAEIFATNNPEANEAQIAAEHTRFTRAPLCLAVISTPILATKPVWEQELSAGAVCMNILHAAHALGYGAKWLTEWVAYDDVVLAVLMSAFLQQTQAEKPSPLAGEGWMGGRDEGSLNPSAPSPQPSPARGEGSPRIAGFIYLGTKAAETEDRERPSLETIMSEY